MLCKDKDTRDYPFWEGYRKAALKVSKNPVLGTSVGAMPTTPKTNAKKLADVGLPVDARNTCFNRYLRRPLASDGRRHSNYGMLTAEKQVIACKYTAIPWAFTF